jgi:hypothetical protein
MLSNFQVKNQSLPFPIRIPLSLRRSLFRQCAQIRQLKFNRFTSQYAFPCHFAEVYFANALKFPTKNQSIPFPIRILLSLRRSLWFQCSQIPQVKKRRLNFQYVFLCHFAEVYYTNAIRSPNKDLSLHFPMRIPLSLRRSLFRQYSQIRQLNTNLFIFQYASLCHFAEVYSANALKFSIKDQSLPFPIRISFPIRIPLSLRRSLIHRCAQIPQSKTNRFTFQYAFLCHFAEVYSVNALKSPK